MRFAIFPVHVSKLSKVLRLPWKRWCQVTQNDLSKPEDLMLEDAIPLKKSAPGPPNISDEHVSCTAPATRNASLQVLLKCPTPGIISGNARKNHHVFLTFGKVRNPLRLRRRKRHLCTFWLRNVLRATTACTFSTSQLPKMFRECFALCIQTSKCASRHNGVQFLISHLAGWLRTPPL